MGRRTRALWRLLDGERGRYAAATAALSLSVACQYAVPPLVGIAIDGLLAGERDFASTWPGRAAAAVGADGTDAGLLVCGVLVVLLSALAGAFLYLRSRWAAVASETIVRRLRDRLYRHLHELPCAWHDRAETGDVVQRCTSDAETLRAFLAVQVTEIGRSAVMLALLVPALVALDPELAVWSLALFPAIFGAAAWFFRRIQTGFRAAEEAEGRLTTVLHENLTGIRVVRAFARADWECGRFGEANAAFRDRQRELMRTMAWFWSSSDLLCLAQVGIVVGVGAARLEAGVLTVGTYAAFVQYLAIAIFPIRHAGRVLMDTGKALVALDRVGELLAARPEPATRAEHAATAGPRVGGAVELRDVTFAYGDAAPVLRGVDLDVHPGETVAVVGPPGSGKSTLVALLLGLYDGWEGEIRIGGHDVRRVDRRALRAQVATVLQEPFLYSRTLAENVRLARPGATPDELESAAAAAAIDATVAGLGDGWDTLVGERGVTLSGGQRQRLALARALLCRSDVLVLDDALSAVDARTEARVLGSLAARRPRPTTLVVSHRLSTVRRADRVVVLDAGRVVQTGSPADLAGRPGPYRHLLELQSAASVEARTFAGARP